MSDNKSDAFWNDMKQMYKDEARKPQRNRKKVAELPKPENWHEVKRDNDFNRLSYWFERNARYIAFAGGVILVAIVVFLVLVSFYTKQMGGM